MQTWDISRSDSGPRTQNFFEGMSKNIKLLTQVKALAVGDVITVALADHSYGYVRNAAYIAGIDLDCRYSARLDRQARTVTVTRVS